MLLIVVFLVAGVFIEDSHESNLPNMTDLPDINATAGESVMFKFIEKFNFSIYECKFGIKDDQNPTPDPVLLIVRWPTENKTVDAKDSRMSFVGQKNKNVWIEFANLRTNDTNTYKVFCRFFSNPGQKVGTATVNLYVQDKPDLSDTTTAAYTTSTVSTTTQATKSTTSRSSKPSLGGNFFSVELLVMAAMMYFMSM